MDNNTIVWWIGLLLFIICIWGIHLIANAKTYEIRFWSISISFFILLVLLADQINTYQDGCEIFVKQVHEMRLHWWHKLILDESLNKFKECRWIKDLPDGFLPPS